MNLIEQGLAAEKMSVVWKKKDPGKLGSEPKTILANSKIRTHMQGIESLQCYSGVGYIFRLDEPDVQEQYERMQKEALEGRLKSIGLLIGFTESHEDSGEFGSLAYMITTANRSHSNYTPSEED